MAITMRYLSSENKLTSANCLEDIPKTAQFIWCDFNQPTEAENTFLKTRFNFNKLEIDDTVTGHRELNTKLMTHISIHCYMM